MNNRDEPATPSEIQTRYFLGFTKREALIKDFASSMLGRAGLSLCMDEEVPKRISKFASAVADEVLKEFDGEHPPTS